MKEYTLLAAISVAAAFLADTWFKTALLRRAEYYIFLSIILCFKLAVNGYLTGKGVVLYDERFYLGIRLGSIPVEDFMFGFSMVTMSIVFWEYFKKKS